VSHHCATLGPRSLAWRRLGMSAKAAEAGHSGQGLGPEAEKARQDIAGRARKEEAFDASC
jgi:hypothetical protein